ncbi:acyl carrier protein [Methylocystis heyeri]|uniref:Acyl carrier protein n=1 Tax=Methylocystis heyeri TaxID=391905 RepID=A0A6B8KID7_9HYPH|nr:acyl carrier protein [Methylocystis heyeri]QGM46675.1 acyl carrier protein [Methylocystis heyeri]
MADAVIFDRLVEIIRTIVGDHETPIHPETKASDVPQWDSMAHISIVVAAESVFKVKFRTAEIERLQVVGDFVDLIERKSK